MDFQTEGESDATQSSDLALEVIKFVTLSVSYKNGEILICISKQSG